MIIWQLLCSLITNAYILCHGVGNMKISSKEINKRVLAPADMYFGWYVFMAVNIKLVAWLYVLIYVHKYIYAYMPISMQLTLRALRKYKWWQ